MYPSFSGAWGITYLYSYLSSSVFHLSQDGKSQLDCISWLLIALKVMIVAVAVSIGWIRRRLPGVEVFSTLAFCWIGFVVLAPGFVPYYLIWMAPFVLIYSARWYVALNVASSMYLFTYYDAMAGGMPWNYADLAARPVWVLWGVIPWLVTCGIAGFGLESVAATSPQTI